MTTANRIGKYWTATLLAVALTVLQGCDGVQVNQLQSLALKPGQTIALNTPLVFVVSGLGRCQRVIMDWGDGTANSITNQGCQLETDANGRKSFRCSMDHTFTGWEGGKTVTATGDGCEGRLNTRFLIQPADWTVALSRPGPNVCDPVPGKPALVARTLVKVRSIGVTHPNPTCHGIRYTNGGCYDADGAAALPPPTSAGNPAFPFPSMRMYTLVLKVGPQVVEGGSDVQFTFDQAGTLELCVNEPNPSQSVGGYDVTIRADQLGPPPPPPPTPSPPPTPPTP